MKCRRCGSLKMIKFIDGFGKRRIFCRSCYGSFLDSSVFNNLSEQRNLLDFNSSIYCNPKAVATRHFR